MNRRAVLILSLVALLVLVTSWLSQKSETPIPTAQQAAAPVADYFIRGFDATVTAPDGLPSHHLTSSSMTHYAESGVVELTQPHLTMYRPEGEQWLVEAEFGRMEGDGNLVTLRGKVILKQASRTQPLQVNTDELLLYPDTQYGETETPVTISAPSGHVSGVGMKVYGKENRLLLLSDVRGRYDSTVR